MVAKHRRSLWLKIDAYDVHEVPRTVLVHDGDRRFLLHSRLDPSVGGYTPYYAVARLPDEHAGASAPELVKAAKKWLGEIPVASVVFDKKAHAIRTTALQRFLE